MTRIAQLLGVLLVMSTLASGGAEAARTEYLSDVILGIGTFTGNMGVDTTPYRVWPKAIVGMPIKIKDKDYAKGLGVDAPGEMVIALDGAYDSFTAEVGVQWQGNPVGDASFRVVVDGQECFNSGVMREADAAKPVSVPIAGAKEMRLLTGGSGMCNWADAKLTLSASAEGGLGVDMSPFAKVVTFDPSRIGGVTVDRLTEIPAADVFLETELKPRADGSYAVPTSKDGVGCIGLQWGETRRICEVGLQFASGTSIPAAKDVRVEYWAGYGIDYVSGESTWQGSWKPLTGEVEQRGDSLVLRSSRETRKIRWLLPKGEGLVCKRVWGLTTSSYKPADLVFQLEKPVGGKQGEVEVYNGQILGPSGPSLRCKWDLSKPLRLKVNYTTPRPWGLDRTVLRVKLPSGAFAVAVDDLLPDEFAPGPVPTPSANASYKTVDDVVSDLYPLGFVYVKRHGFYATAEPAKLTLAQYKEKIEGRKSVLEQVRQMPDQSWSKAMDTLYYSIQDNCPTQISLGWDNRKVVVDRFGAVHYGPAFLDFVEYKHAFEVSAQFGSGKNEGFVRNLDNGWMPIPHIRVDDGGLVYHQSTFVAPLDKDTDKSGAPWLYKRPVCVAQYTIENPGEVPANASLAISFFSDSKARGKATVASAAGRTIATKGDALLAVLDTADASGLKVEVGDGVATLTGALPGKSSARCYVFMPVEWEIKPGEQATLADGAGLRKAAEDYWREAMAPAMKIDIPDKLLENLILASEVHCINASENEEDGKFVEANIAATYYGSLDSESHGIIRGMDFMGQTDFARRALGFFVKRENPAGYFSHGYTLMGTGHHMSGLSQHYWLTGDSAWWSDIEPRVAKMCEWMAAQSEKTKRLDAGGNKVPEYGLQPPGTAADWQHWGYIFAPQSHYYLGARNAARALADSGDPNAAKYARYAETFRKDLEGAYHWTQQRTPVIGLRDGTWVPGAPYELYGPGPIQQFFPNYSIWYYSPILGAHHLVSQGVLDPNSEDVGYIINELEDTEFLKQGDAQRHPLYEEGRKKNWFDWGGVMKLQPYYMRILEVYADRDDVKPFIRSYFHSAVVEFNREDMCMWEGNWANSVWNKTAETGGFLYQTRIVFVTERDKDLWLAPFVTSHWMKDGLKVAIGDAPTYFGPVSYEITSHVGEGYIEATIDPPTRKAPRAVVIRLRHPDGKPMRRVTVNGKDSKSFDASKETVTLKGCKSKAVVKAYY